MRTKIIFEDHDILVIQKPAGIAVQTAQVGRPDVVSELKNHLAVSGTKSPYLGVIHRLDQPVEGLLVFAKNPKAAANLSAQLQKDDFAKEYLAVVCGKPVQESGELVDYLVKEGNVARVCEDEDLTSIQTTQSPSDKKDTKDAIPKRATLQYKLRETKEMAGVEVALLEIKLETGRFHQIRVQLSHAGYPILGDAKYGSEKCKEVSMQAGIRNTALCAYRLRFIHPTSKKEMVYTVEPMGEAFKNFS